jgi:transposase
LVFFFDEGRFGTQPDIGRFWARRGVKPRVQVFPGYQNFYLYSSVSPMTGESFTLFLPWVNTEMMNLYLERLSLAYPGREILLFWDGAGWHRSKKLVVPPLIRLERLPPYSPELNPAELLWLWLRRHACRNRLFRRESQVMDSLQKQLRDLNPAKTRQLCHCEYLDNIN